MKKRDWIVFDVGGVLLNWHESSTALAEYLQVDKNILMETMFEQAKAMNIGKISPREGWRRVLEKLGKDEDPQDIIRKWRHESYWMKDTLKLIRELDEAGYNLAILSNSWLGLTEIEELPILPPEIKLFKYILDSSVEGIKKPDPAFYKLAEERLESDKNSMFFIDDDEDNLPPASEREWRTFHYVTGDDNGVASNDKLRELLLIS